MTTPADQRVRDRIRHDLDTTLIIEAAAGTGKTTELVNRIIAVIASGRAQLRSHRRGDLYRKGGRRAEAATARGNRTRVPRRKGIQRSRAASICSMRWSSSKRRASAPSIRFARTCCASGRSRRASIPLSRLRPKISQPALFESAFERWFEETLKNPGPGMRRLLRRRDAIQGEGPRPIARGAANALREWRDFDAAWQRVPFDRDREIDRHRR